MINQIVNYLRLNPRNKIIISESEIDGVKYFDVGLEFAKVLIDFPPSKHFALKANMELGKLLDGAGFNFKDHTPALAIKNIGVLLESELKIDFLSLLNTHSREKALFLKWDGEILGDDLYFLSRNKGNNINIENLSHIII